MKKLRQVLAACIVSAAFLTGCSAPQETKIRDFDNLAGKKIVVQEGTMFEDMLHEKYPSYNVISVPTFIDIYKTLIAGNADYGVDEDVTVSLIMAGGLSVDTSYTNTPPAPMGAVFNKNNTELQSQFNDFITELENSGQLAEIRNKWFNSSSPSTLPVPEGKVKEGKPLNVITEGDFAPFNLTVGGKISGFEAELSAMFADKLGRPLKFTVIPFHEIIQQIADGKGDMSLSGFSITEERAKIISFSKPYNYTHTILVSMKHAK